MRGEGLVREAGLAAGWTSKGITSPCSSLEPQGRLVPSSTSLGPFPPPLPLFIDHWTVRSVRVGSKPLPSLHTHDPPCSINACSKLVSKHQPTKPPPGALLGLESSEGTERPEPTSPVAFTSQGWRRAPATGSSGTHAGPLSPSHSVPGRTPSVSPCDGTSACGENNSHMSTACS